MREGFPYPKQGTVYHALFLHWEREMLVYYLSLAGGNRCMAAYMLGVHRNTISRRLAINHITKEDISAIRSRSNVKTWSSADSGTLEPRGDSIGPGLEQGDTV